MMREEDRRILTALIVMAAVTALIAGGYFLVNGWPSFADAAEPAAAGPGARNSGEGYDDVILDLKAALENYGRAQAQCPSEHKRERMERRINAEWMIADIRRGYYDDLDPAHLRKRSASLVEDLNETAAWTALRCPVE